MRLALRGAHLVTQPYADPRAAVTRGERGTHPRSWRSRRSQRRVRWWRKRQSPRSRRACPGPQQTLQSPSAQPPFPLLRAHQRRTWAPVGCGAVSRAQRFTPRGAALTRASSAPPLNDSTSPSALRFLHTNELTETGTAPPGGSTDEPAPFAAPDMVHVGSAGRLNWHFVGFLMCSNNRRLFCSAET